MAISIVSNFTTNKFYPSQNPINVTVNSTNTGNCNFRYICDLYINGIKVFTDKLFPDPTTGYGFFQLSRVLQDYMKTLLPQAPQTNYVTLGSSATAPAAAISVYCRFGEEYDSSTNCDGTVVQYPNLSTSNTFYCYQAAFDYEDFPTYSDTPYKGVWASASNIMKFLTNSPREVEVTYNDSFNLDFISLTSPTAFTSIGAGNVAINITYYNKDTSSSGLTVPVPSLATVRRYRIACGPYDINKIGGTVLISQNTDYYTVKLVWQVGINNPFDLSETFTFKVKPPKAFQTRIAFIGLLGGIEHFTFYHRNIKQFDVERKTFEKTLQSNNSGVWKYNVGDRGTTVYSVNAREKHTVSSYCTREVSEWLYEMWLSPEVWTYLRPNLIEWRNFKEGNPNVVLTTDRILFWLSDDHGLEVGDGVYVLPSEENTNWNVYSDLFTVQSVDGNLVDLGVTVGYFVEYGACGFLYKDEDWRRLPVVISDNTVEVKQKTSRPVEYTLNYGMAYNKTTLR